MYTANRLLNDFCSYFVSAAMASVAYSSPLDPISSYFIDIYIVLEPDDS
jgi:hypothetical protein